MAKSDVRPIASNYRRSYGGRGYSRSSYEYTYDDEGRGESKDVWEWFEENFNANPTLEWLLSWTDMKYYQVLKASTFRYGLLDIAVE